jgi:hypothetical protein
MTANAQKLFQENQHKNPISKDERTVSAQGCCMLPRGLSLREVADTLGASVITGQEHLDVVINSACCSDLMSDVLAFVHEKSLILTGIANAHVLRTAEMLDLKCIVFVRGKQPTDDVVELARELGITLMSVNKTMFTSAGLLYQAGMRGTPMKWASREGTGQQQ